MSPKAKMLVRDSGCAGKKITDVGKIIIALDKSGYQVNLFVISPQKHMLWVLSRSASARRF